MTMKAYQDGRPSQRAPQDRGGDTRPRPIGNRACGIRHSPPVHSASLVLEAEVLDRLERRDGTRRLWRIAAVVAAFVTMVLGAIASTRAG